MSRRWPIVGRSSDVDTVLALLRQTATGGTTRGVVLHGPAGIGKTSVARQLADAAIEAGYVTEWLTAPSTTGAPLLAHLARRNLVFVVATARGSSTRPAIFRPMIVDGTFDAIEVMPLSDAEIIDAAEIYLGSALEPAAARAIATATGGVGLFAREYVVANVVSGTLAADGDGDVWRFTAPPGVPPTLVELVNARSEDVTVEQRSFLDVLAMVQPLPSSLLPIAELAALEDMGLIATDIGDHDSIRFAHPLFAEAVSARHGPLRRRAIAEKALTLIEQLPVSDPDRELRIAVHCLVHDLSMSDELAVDAARQALNAVDPGLARRLIERVEHATWNSQFVLGAALAVSGEIASADVALTVATELATTDEHHARTASRRANSLGTGGARFTEAIQVLDEAKSSLTDPHWRAFLDADRAYLQLALGVPTDVSISSSDATCSTSQRVPDRCRDRCTCRSGHRDRIARGGRSLAGTPLGGRCPDRTRVAEPVALHLAGDCWTRRRGEGHGRCRSRTQRRTQRNRRIVAGDAFARHPGHRTGADEPTC